MENQPVYIWEVFSITCSPAVWMGMIMFQVLICNVMWFDFTWQAGRKQYQKKTISPNFGMESYSQLLVRVHMCDVWVMERGEKPAGGWDWWMLHWNGSSAEGPISQRIYSTGSPYWIPNSSSCCSVVWLCLVGFILYTLPINLYHRCVLFKLKIELLEPL